MASQSRDPINKMEMYTEGGIQKWRPAPQPEKPAKRKKSARPRTPKTPKRIQAPE